MNKAKGWYIAGGALLFILVVRACGKSSPSPSTATPVEALPGPATAPPSPPPPPTQTPLQRAALEAMKSESEEQRQARKRADAEVAEDRRNGVWITREGYIGAATKAKLDEAMTLIATGDEAAFAQLLARDPMIFKLKPGLKVNVSDSGGLLSGIVKVRLRGELAEIWTVREAIQQP